MKSTTTTTNTNTKPPKSVDSPRSDNSTTLTTNPMFYEPTSVLDPHLTSSPAAIAATINILPNSSSTTSILPPPSSDLDGWDPLSFFNMEEDNSFLDLDLDLPPPPPQPPMLPPSSFDRPHLDLLLKAAASIESNDIAAAHLILSRLHHHLTNNNSNSSPLQRAAFHFKDALLSLLPIPNPPTPSPHPPLSPLEIVNRIAAQKSFSHLSPIPHFTSFTANQTILESLFSAESPHQQPIHIIDFDIGLGGQWSSFLQEIAARSKSLRTPPPHIRITAVVPDESIETVLAAENLRDFAHGMGIALAVSFVHVGSLGTLALSRVRLSAGEAVGVVLTPAIFRLVGGTPESTAALLLFIKQVSAKILVFVDGECYGNSTSFRRSFALGLEFYSSVLESLDAAAGAVEGEEGEELAAAARRVETGVVRGRIFAAVEGWAPRGEALWREVLAGGGMTGVGFSEFTECQADWLVRRAPAEGFHVARREGALVLSWRGRELASTSAWRC